MPRVTVNAIELEYETLGDAGDPALLLVMGLGAQLIEWPDELFQGLAARHFFVIRYDNRDSGLSTQLDGLGVPDPAGVVTGAVQPPYLLADLAADAVGLLDALGIGRAHLVGASMGGMIAQQVAIDHPERVLSLGSIMSNTGDRTSGLPTPEALAVLGRPPAASREEALANALNSGRILGSLGFGAPEEDLRRRAETKYDRAYTPLGTLRQYAAILASPDRTGGLRRIAVPTVVIHGDADPLVTLGGGQATVAAVPGAELVVIEGMGHGFPPAEIPRLVTVLADNADRAGTR